MEKEKGVNIKGSKKNGNIPRPPTVWFSLKKSLQCKSEPSEVSEPIRSRKHHQQQQLSTISTARKIGGGGRSGCSRSIANLKDVIHGSKRHIEKPPSCSPRSIGSSEFLNPIVHEVILSNSTCELKITGFGGQLPATDGGVGGGNNGGGNDGGGSMFVGTLKPGTPGPGGHPTMHYFNNNNKMSSSSSTGGGTGSNVSSRKSPAFWDKGELLGSSFGGSRHSHRGVSLDSNANNGGGSSAVVKCHKCGDQFKKWDALEAHHLSKHAVTELIEGDSSRKIVEIICKTSWLNSQNHCGRIERVLKVHNMQKTIARFEEYRETVKIKASKLSKKHPRCLADGNELLRFHGTTIACSLGLNGSSSLCVSEKCCVCRIIRHGFSISTTTKKVVKESTGISSNKMNNGIGVFTTSTSGRAFESIKMNGGEGEEEGGNNIRKALIVCRVIAGRVHRPLENLQELVGQTGFDSVAGKVGLYSNIEELYLLNPRALLPCFVVICKP